MTFKFKKGGLRFLEMTSSLVLDALSLGPSSVTTETTVKITLEQSSIVSRLEVPVKQDIISIKLDGGGRELKRAELVNIIRNSRSPKVDPCVTPELTLIGMEDTPSRTTH